MLTLPVLTAPAAALPKHNCHQPHKGDKSVDDTHHLWLVLCPLLLLFLLSWGNDNDNKEEEWATASKQEGKDNTGPPVKMATIKHRLGQLSDINKHDTTVQHTLT